MVRRLISPLVLVLVPVFACAEDDLGRADATGEVGTADDANTETASSDGSGDSETGQPDLPGDCARLEQLLADLADESDPGIQQQLIGEFIDAVSNGEHGFPITDGNKLAAVHQGDPGQSLSLVGDFNAWEPGLHPFEEVVPGFYVAIAQLPAPAAGIYKLQQGNDYFADPLARRFAWDEFGEYAQIDPIAGRSHYERWPGFDQGVGLLQPRTVTVYVPADAIEDGLILPTLYMHDGQNLFSPDALFGGWQVGATLDEAVGQALLDPILVVGVDNTPARFDEYTQIGDVLDGNPAGGRADEYADFLAMGVKPFIEARYPAAVNADEVGVMGSSLGGLVSLYIGQRHRDLFANVASMSGTVDWGTFGANNPTIIDDYAVDPPIGVRIYLDTGGDAGLGCPQDGSDNYCGNVVLADQLRDQGWVDELDLFHRWEPGAPHNEAAWAGRFLPALLDWWP